MEGTKTSLYPQGSAGNGGDQRLIHLALAAWGFSSWILFNGTLRGDDGGFPWCRWDRGLSGCEDA